MMIERLGDTDSSKQIASRWKELVILGGDIVPPRYDIAYPRDLLFNLCENVFSGCQKIGLVPWDSQQYPPGLVGPALDAAWSEFRLRPESFGGYEQQAIAELIAKIP
jgi:hypothetical protein